MCVWETEPQSAFTASRRSSLQNNPCIAFFCQQFTAVLWWQSFKEEISAKPWGLSRSQNHQIQSEGVFAARSKEIRKRTRVLLQWGSLFIPAVLPCCLLASSGSQNPQLLPHWPVGGGPSMAIALVPCAEHLQWAWCYAEALDRSHSMPPCVSQQVPWPVYNLESWSRWPKVTVARQEVDPGHVLSSISALSHCTIGNPFYSLTKTAWEFCKLTSLKN